MPGASVRSVLMSLGFGLAVVMVVLVGKDGWLRELRRVEETKAVHSVVSLHRVFIVGSAGRQRPRR